MPKYRVTINYAVYTTEIHEIEFSEGDEEDAAALADFLDEDTDPSEFTCDTTLKERIEGDCVDGTWNTHIEEINPLDRIVTALVESDKQELPE